MAALTAFLPSRVSSRGFAAIRTKQNQLLRNWQSARAHREEVSRMTQQLAGCTDRELADLGLYRSEIPVVANGTYRRA